MPVLPNLMQPIYPGDKVLLLYSKPGTVCAVLFSIDLCLTVFIGIHSYFQPPALKYVGFVLFLLAIFV